MHQRFLFGVVLATAGILAACGGSSSETPPPLQPDPNGFRYAPLQPIRADAEEDADAGDAPRGREEEPEEEAPKAPARSTWGAGH